MFVFGESDLITADGPPGFKRLVLTHIKCTLTHWFITADGPVFERRTVRDYAEKSVTTSFLGELYVYPCSHLLFHALPTASVVEDQSRFPLDCFLSLFMFCWPFEGSLGHFESTLDIFELVFPSLTYSLLRDCILVSMRAS